MTVPPLHRAARARRGAALAVAVALALPAAGARAFPLLDATAGDLVPAGSELAPQDAQALRHQLGLINGLGAPAGGGWTFIPRVDFQEELTDNVLQAHSPRKWDLVSFLAPGFSLAGSLPRVQVTLSLTPTLTMYARTPSLNSLTEDLTGLASVTVVTDLAFVDVRALAGVRSKYGGSGGIGSAAGSLAGASGSGLNGLAGNTQGLTRDNEVQTASFGVSPYLLRRFGDFGTGKIGTSLDVTRSASLSGFAALPFPSGGANGQTLVTTEQMAQFTSGDVLDDVQNTFSFDATQSRTRTEAGYLTAANGLTTAPVSSTSSKLIATDRVTYQVNRTVSVFASGGHEELSYSGGQARGVNDLVWSFGTTVTPSPSSTLTVSYGHENGFNSVTANGRFALGSRTAVNLSYAETLGTQLEYVQSQLNLASNSNGALVNGLTQGALFGPTNGLAAQDGVFRTNSLTVGTVTSLDRDTVSLNLSLTKQTSARPGAGAGTSSTARTGSVSWLHLLRPDMTVNASTSYTVQAQAVGLALTPGDNTTLTVGAGWQWQLSDKVSVSVRYSFFDRSSASTVYNIYQHIVVLGISKSF